MPLKKTQKNHISFQSKKEKSSPGVPSPPSTCSSELGHTPGIHALTELLPREGTNSKAARILPDQDSKAANYSNVLSFRPVFFLMVKNCLTHSIPLSWLGAIFSKLIQPFLYLGNFLKFKGAIKATIKKVLKCTIDLITTFRGRGGHTA